MKKNLQELSNEELLKEAKNSKFIFGIYLGIIIVMIIAGISNTIKNGISYFTFLPIVFLGIAMMFWSNYDKVRKEIKSRNLN